MSNGLTAAPAFPATPLVSPAQAASLPVLLVLASGRGKRFRASGGTCHKLQADLCGSTVLQRTLQAVQRSGLRWHLEDAGHPGMGDSIAAAVRSTDSDAGWMVLPADLPLVLPQTLVLIAQWPLQAEVLVPWVHGTKGHPVRFSAGCGQALRDLSGEQGAAGIVARSSVQRLEVEDAGCVLDIDTLQDLQRARDYLFQRSDPTQQTQH